MNILPDSGTWNLWGTPGVRDIRAWILTIALWVGGAVLLSLILCRVLRDPLRDLPGGKRNTPVILALTALFAVAVLLRYGPSAEALRGLFLGLVLVYASCRDLRTHEVGDYVFVIILALSLPGLTRETLFPMLLSGLAVFLPQIALAVLPPHKTLGGADIKISTALTVFLGGWRGIFAYLAGLVAAVVFMSIRNRVRHTPRGEPFALVPFLGAGAMLLFLI